MKNVINYLDDLKAKFGSDNKAAESLGIQRTTIANIRKRGQLSDETALKMADLLGVDRGELLLAAAMARSEGETKSAWDALARRLNVAAGVVLAISLAWTGGDFWRQESGVFVDNIHYTKSRS